VNAAPRPVGLSDLIAQEEARLAEREAQPAPPPADAGESGSAGAPAVPAPVGAPAGPATRKTSTAPRRVGKAKGPAKPKRALAAAPEPGEATAAAADAAQVALELVTGCCASARYDPRTWGAATVRLPPELARELRIRIATDRQATGNRQLAANHYLEAAFSRVPEGLEDAAGWGLAWRQAHAGARTETTGSGSRLRKVTAARMSDLASWLPTLDVRPVLWEVEAEALRRFLADLAPAPGAPPGPPPGTSSSAPAPPPPP
jgi:hypothetical protein